MTDEPSYRLTVGEAKDGRILAIITEGGHPQMAGDRQCKVCELRISEGADSDSAWFDNMIIERPWETRQ
jgi:hypothetical protein